MELIKINKENPRKELEKLDKNTLIEMILAQLSTERFFNTESFDEFIK